MIRDAILQSIHFIEENLKNAITVRDVADKACYSLYHFIRLFEAITGHTPGDYIQRRRISEAFKELKGSSKKVIDAGFDYQFGSPEAFTRSFKRITGLSPSQLKKCNYVSEQNLLAPIDRDSLPFVENMIDVEVQKITMKAITLTGIVTLIRQDKRIISQLWSYMAKELPHLNSLQTERFFGHSFWSNDYDIEGFFLLCGIEVGNITGTQAPLCHKIIGQGTYLKFIHKGNIENIRHSYKYIFQTYLPKTDYKLNKPYDFEIYLNNGTDPHSDESTTEILIPVD